MHEIISHIESARETLRAYSIKTDTSTRGVAVRFVLGKTEFFLRMRRVGIPVPQCELDTIAELCAVLSQAFDVPEKVREATRKLADAVLDLGTCEETGLSEG